jgi:hypothetical protein
MNRLSLQQSAVVINAWERERENDHGENLYLAMLLQRRDNTDVYSTSS